MASTDAAPAMESVMDSATLDIVEMSDALISWVASKVKEEVARVASMGSKCVPVPVACCGTDVEGSSEAPTVVHVIQAATKFDFSRVNQVMLSETSGVPDEVAGGSDLHLMFVVLLGDKPVPLLMPYLVPGRLVGALQEWCFVNSTLASVRHSVETFTDVTE